MNLVSGNAASARAVVITVTLAFASGCFLFRHASEEHQISGAVLVAREVDVQFPVPIEPAHHEFAVCLRLPKAYRRLPSGWDIVAPDATVTSVSVEPRAGSERVPFTAPEFLVREDGTFACFHEAAGPGPAARRKYTSVSIRSSRPLAVQAVVVRSYDPK